MHQERLLDELNGVLIEQRAMIDRLQGQLDRLKEQMASGGDASEGAHDEKPPHY